MSSATGQPGFGWKIKRSQQRPSTLVIHNQTLARHDWTSVTVNSWHLIINLRVA